MLYIYLSLMRVTRCGTLTLRDESSNQKGVEIMHCANYEGAYLASSCWRQHLKPKDGEKPVELWTNRYCQHISLYYMPEQLEPCTEEYYKKQLEAYKERRRADAQAYRQRKKMQLLKERMWEIRRPRTAWQWLSESRRKIRPDAKAFPHTYKKYGFDDFDGYYVVDTSTWFYYQYEDTVETTDEEYEQLKAEYIKKFGGWETIDLEHTTYDGHKWY